MSIATPNRLALALAACSALLIGLALALGTCGDATRLERLAEDAAPTRADPVPYDGRSPREPAGVVQRVVVALPRPALGARADIASMSATAQRRYVASLRREARALRSALNAKGISLGDVVAYERVFNGFAATVRTGDLPALAQRGVRPEPIRRFYPAIAEPVPGGPMPAKPVLSPDELLSPVVAVLAGGTDTAHPHLAGRTVLGYDAVDHDRRAEPGPDPRDARKREQTGTMLASVVVTDRGRVRPIRVSALRAGPHGTEEYATTDTLLAGLERAADPDGDGDTSDHDAVALVGVNAPYAGFSRTPEASAAAAAERLGLHVVAPAGGEGRGADDSGTVGSPAGARAALAVAALGDPAGVGRIDLMIGSVTLDDAVLLAGRAPGQPLPREGVAVDDPVAFLRGAPALRGKVAVVEASGSPGAQAAAAAAAGATAVLLAEPRDRPLTAISAGRAVVPVIGVTGKSAQAVLAAGGTDPLRFGPLRPAVPKPSDEPAPASSRGPTLDGLAKPDLSAPGSAQVALPDGGAGATGGTAVAAAHVAAALARALDARPRASRVQLRDTLVETGFAPVDVDLPAGEPEPVPVGPLVLRRRGGRVTGVRFALGAFERGDPFTAGTRVRAASRLELDLVGPNGRVVRRLTPPGGALGLLPAEYSYTLPATTRRGLTSGPYTFRATARTPRRREPTVRSSEAFR